MKKIVKFRNDSQIDCYQELILAEFTHLQRTDFIFDSDLSRISSEQAENICGNFNIQLQEMIEDRLLVPYDNNTYRTMHIELLHRAINAKSAEWSPKLSLEYRLVEPQIEDIPSFDEHNLEELRALVRVNPAIQTMLIDSLKEAGYLGIAHHQKYLLERIFERNSLCYLLVSPTASGKSLIFYLATLASILSDGNSNGTKSIVIYPRKALASDQLLKFLRVIHILNKKLLVSGIRQIAIGIDDGDTPRSVASYQVQKKEIFRGIKCIQHGCKGNLRYSSQGSTCRIACDECGHIYDEITPTKGDIWKTPPSIVFTNLSAFNRRLMTEKSQGMVGRSVDWIILDEVHIYREETGGHARWLLRRVLSRFDRLVKGNAKLIVSSATVHDPLKYINKLTGIPPNKIFYEDYQTILASSRKKKRKLTLNLILAPNPLRSAESLAEEIALLCGTWGYSNAKKTILFVDSVAEVERLRDFIVDTIILERQAHNDHIENNRPVQDSFSWSGIVRNANNIDADSLASIFHYHYAELDSEKRAKVEEIFKANSSGLLISTSTMELGLDIGDIATVIQYKVPLTAESYVQRIGRAGRSNSVGRIAVGIMVLTNGPSQIRYVLEGEHKRLLQPNADIPVAWNNEEIRKQHTFYSILDFQASNNKNTFMDFSTEISGKWRNIKDALHSLDSIVGDAKKGIDLLHAYNRQIDETEATIRILDDLLDSISQKILFGLQFCDSLGEMSVNENLLKLRRSEDSILEIYKSIGKILELSEELELTSTNELVNYQSALKKSRNTLGKTLQDMERLWRH